MQDFAESFAIAFDLVASLDADLLEIVLLSLRVSLSAVGLAVVIGLPLGAALGVSRFPGRGAVSVAHETRILEQHAAEWRRPRQRHQTPDDSTGHLFASAVRATNAIAALDR